MKTNDMFVFFLSDLGVKKVITEVIYYLCRVLIIGRGERAIREKCEELYLQNITCYSMNMVNILLDTVHNLCLEQLFQ